MPNWNQPRSRPLTLSFRPLFLAALVLALGCGGGGGGKDQPPGAVPATWVTVDAAVDAVQGQFPGGLAVEILTPAGVVYSHALGGFSPTSPVLVGSGSKWVSATVLLRLVEQGVLSLDATTGSILQDASGQPWTGNLGQARLRHLLSFTTGISGDVPASENTDLTLDEAVKIVYADQGASASPAGSYFHYGSTHLRIAARMAEVATGKTWSQIVREQLGNPLGWPLSANFGGPNYNPAGGLYISGQDYERFLSLQLRRGLFGGQRLLAEALLDQQMGVNSVGCELSISEKGPPPRHHGLSQSFFREGA